MPKKLSISESKNRKNCKRARISLDKMPDSTPSPALKRKTITRARTLTDLLNTLDDKSKPNKKKCSTQKCLSKENIESTSPLTESNSSDLSQNSKLEVSNSKDLEKELHKHVVHSEAIATRGSKGGSGPTSRWGHSLCMINEEQFLMIGGQGDKQQFCKDSIWHLDLVRRKWSVPETEASGMKPEMRTGHTAVYDPTLRSIYIYGGSKNLKWFSDVHMLDVDTMKWTLIKANGKAPTRSYHTTTLYRHELWVFGGVFPLPDPQPDGCCNDVHVFSPLEESWYSPIVMGDKPLPRSGHSATILHDKLIIFGGWDTPYVYQDLYMLDMVLLEWSKPEVKGNSPSPRSWHSSCALSGNRVLIHGGYNGDIALDDSFIFDLDTLSWTSLRVEPPISSRCGHVSICLPYRYENHNKDEAFVFGGGDNDGHFFKDLVSLFIPIERQLPKHSDSTCI